MGQDIVGSKLHPEIGYGETSDLNPSSLTPGQTIKRGAVGRTLHNPVTVPTDSGQTRTVSAKPIKPAHGMNPPSHPIQIQRALERQRKK